MNDCPHCGNPVFKSSSNGTKLKAKTSMIVLHKSGEVEINCGHCRKGVLVPLQPVGNPQPLQKANAPRLVVSKTSSQS